MRKNTIWQFVALIANVSIMFSPARAAEGPIVTASATKPSPVDAVAEVREFEVRVDDKPRGTHSLTIKSVKGKHEVAIQTDVRFDFVVYAYVFKFRGTEVWRDGHVEFADIRCEDGNKRRAFSLKTDGTTQQVSFNGKALPVASPGIMTTAYWQLPHSDHRAKTMTILDVDTGATRDARLQLVGPTTVSCSGRSLDCQHFRIDGPSPAELWFDNQSRLVGQKSIEQGHSMELRLKQIRISNDDH